MSFENIEEQSGENPESFRFPDEEKPVQENEPRPEKLFRGVSINPDELTVERLRQELIPGLVNKDDATKVQDGNELGVYMSTNPRMVETAYAKGGRGVSQLETPAYAGNRGTERGVQLPGCGIIYEITTDGLQIRKPEITEVLKGVYNNGFQGDEWIADMVDPKHYTIAKLILSRYANDSEQFVLPITDNSEEGLQQAVDVIQAEFAKRKAMAEEFKSVIERMTDAERRNEFIVQRVWNRRKAELATEAAKNGAPESTSTYDQSVKKAEPLFPRVG